MMNEDIRTEIVELLVDNFGKRPFTYAMLAKALGDKLTSRRLCYKIMTELVVTGHVVRTQVVKKNQIVAGWQIRPDNEDHAVKLWAKYPSE